MNYTKATLQGTLEAVLNDIKNIEYKGEKVYPNWPENYEFIGNSVFDRFVVTAHRQIVISPATYDESGEEITPALMGDWTCNIVLPFGHDTTNLITKV